MTTKILIKLQPKHIQCIEIDELFDIVCDLDKKIISNLDLPSKIQYINGYFMDYSYLIITDGKDKKLIYDFIENEVLKEKKNKHSNVVTIFSIDSDELLLPKTNDERQLVLSYPETMRLLRITKENIELDILEENIKSVKKERVVKI